MLAVLEKLSMLHDFSVHADMFAAPVFEFLLKYYIPTNVYPCQYGDETPETRNWQMYFLYIDQQKYIYVHCKKK